MAWVHVRHSVEDYAKWKQVYDETATFKRGMGWKRYMLFSVEGNANDVLVLEEFGSVEEARAFLASPQLHEAMANAGVSGPPEIIVVEELESGAA